MRGIPTDGQVSAWYIKESPGRDERSGDKSISHRAVMLGALSNGETHVTDFLNGADCLSTIGCFRAMGVPIEISDDEKRSHCAWRWFARSEGTGGNPRLRELRYDDAAHFRYSGCADILFGVDGRCKHSEASDEADYDTA